MGRALADYRLGTTVILVLPLLNEFVVLAVLRRLTLVVFFEFTVVLLISCGNAVFVSFGVPRLT